MIYLVVPFPVTWSDST